MRSIGENLKVCLRISLVDSIDNFDNSVYTKYILNRTRRFYMQAQVKEWGNSQGIR